MCVYNRGAFEYRSLLAEHRRRTRTVVYTVCFSNAEGINASGERNNGEQQLPPIYADSNPKDPATDDFIPSNTQRLKRSPGRACEGDHHRRRGHRIRARANDHRTLLACA